MKKLFSSFAEVISKQNKMGDKESNKIKEVLQQKKFKKVIQENRQENLNPKTSKLVTNEDAGRKYQKKMIEVLEKTQFKVEFKKKFEYIILNQVTKEELMQTISAVKNLKNNSFVNNSIFGTADSLLKQKPEDSQKVVINFNTQKRKTSIIEGEPVFIHKERTTKGRFSRIQDYLRNELNSKYHPFGKLCKGLERQIKKMKFYSSQTFQEFEIKANQFSKVIKMFCHYIIEGCLFVYEKWILQYMSLSKEKYKKWVYHIVMNKIWSVNDSSLHQAMSSLLKNIKVPLNLEYLKLLGLKPGDFSIKKKFQIEGKYMEAIFQTSELTSSSEPQQILKQLQKIKASICSDIDTFHSLEEDGQVYQIDSDNMIGITIYLLCKMGQKIQQIQIQLLLLLLVYGDNVYFQMGESSHMYSTFIAGKDFLSMHYGNNEGKMDAENSTESQSLKD